MKILFLIPPPLDDRPPAERIFGCNYGVYSQPNIFVLYPATILKKAGHEVTCLDFPVEGRSRADFEVFCGKQDYDFIFFYTVFLSKRTDIMARDMLAAVNDRTRFVFLATEPSATPDDFVDRRSVVIRGESEGRVLAVVEALAGSGSLAGIPAISRMEEGRVVNQGGHEPLTDLDSLPFPDRNLLDPGRYNNPRLGTGHFTVMLASRGCSFSCYYCVPNSLSFAREIEHKREELSGKPPVRLRSPANVVAEAAQLAKEGYRSISFIDDQFVWGAKRTIEICEGLKPLGIEWSCLARADMLQDEEVVMAMGRAGCQYVDIGIESFDQAILDDIRKGLKVEMVYSAVGNLKKAGIEPKLNILIGSSPLETSQTIERTFQEALRLDLDYVLFSVCTPFPYTEFNAIAREEGWMLKPEYEAIDPMKESFISYPHLSKEELDRTIRRLYRRYYLRPGYICKRLRKLHGFRDLVEKSRAAISILR